MERPISNLSSRRFQCGFSLDEKITKILFHCYRCVSLASRGNNDWAIKDFSQRARGFVLLGLRSITFLISLNDGKEKKETHEKNSSPTPATSWATMNRLPFWPTANTNGRNRCEQQKKNKTKKHNDDASKFRLARTELRVLRITSWPAFGYEAPCRTHDFQSPKWRAWPRPGRRHNKRHAEAIIAKTKKKDTAMQVAPKDSFDNNSGSGYASPSRKKYSDTKENKKRAQESLRVYRNENHPTESLVFFLHVLW